MECNNESIDSRGCKRKLAEIGKQEKVKYFRGDSDIGHGTEETNDISCNKSQKEKRKQGFLRNDSGYSSCEIEDDADVIGSCDVKTSCQKEPPVYSNGCYTKWCQNNGGNRATGSGGIFTKLKSSFKQKSPIFILHSQATDDPKLGDKFGASVETLKSSSGDYHTHVIKDVEKGGVADSMKIRNGDQLVLMNGTFLPKLGHKNVLELFKNVPVDSHTRLSLVLRRFQKDATSEWVTTSAILIAELASEPAVKELKFATDPGTQKIWTHWYRLQIQGTEMFVMISQGQVGVEVGKDVDIAKYNICVRSKCEFDSHLGTYSYKACVSGIHHEDRNRDSYLTVKNDESICLNTQPQWFGFGLRGREMSFEDLDLRKYLACQLSNYGATGKLCVEDDRFTFQAIGIKGSYDHTDGHMNVYSEHDLRNSQSSNGSMETDESSSEPLSLTQSSISSHSSSLDSGSGSQTDSGYEGLSVRTSGFEEQDCQDILLETGGKHLSCKTPTTPMANLDILHGLGSTEHNP